MKALKENLRREYVGGDAVVERSSMNSSSISSSSSRSEIERNVKKEQ